MSNIEHFVERIAGDWIGSEKMIVDPASGQEMTTEARLSNVSMFGGSGFASDYAQSSEGVETFRCVTQFRFGADDELTAIWMPSEGDHQVFRGKREDMVIEMASESEDGSIQTIKTDYSGEGEFSTTTTVTVPDGPTMTVFEGTYRRA